MNKERPMWTRALEVTLEATKTLERTDCHGTADGIRSVVNYDGQKYEILVNPLHEYSETLEERKCSHDVA